MSDWRLGQRKLVQTGRSASTSSAVRAIDTTWPLASSRPVDTAANLLNGSAST